MSRFSIFSFTLLLSLFATAASAETYCNTRTGACGAYSAVVRNPTDASFLVVQTPSRPVSTPTTPAQQVQSQLNQSGSACNGYWYGGRCVPNGQVAYNGGSPVNVMNQPKPVNAGGGKKQVCSLVYKYVGGRVVGNAQTVCTFQ